MPVEEDHVDVGGPEQAVRQVAAGDEPLHGVTEAAEVRRQLVGPRVVRVGDQRPARLLDAGGGGLDRGGAA